MSSLSVAAFWIVLITGIWLMIFGSILQIVKLPEKKRQIRQYVENKCAKGEIEAEEIEQVMKRVIGILVLPLILDIIMGILLCLIAFGAI